jgi:2-oxo-4-hydroxy-4-carboxy--5-ureidoimidazoline (OHCU) decarboxylase
MRELPGKLSVEELTRLFSGRTRLVDELARREHPLAIADDVAAELPEEDQIAALRTHPRIGEASGEQRGDVPEELAALNDAYEAKFGFPFVVFVAGRTRAELVPILRARLGNTREEELTTGLRELVAIARDRWTRT